MYCDLAPYFEQITVVYVPGNHGRRTQKKDHHGAHDNWDYLIAEIAELHCVDHENIEFVIPKAFSINLSIEGIGFNIFHGDDVRGSPGATRWGGGSACASDRLKVRRRVPLVGLSASAIAGRL